MKTPQEYLDNSVKHHGSHLQMADICVTEFVALEAIKKAQIEAIDEAVKLCAERESIKSICENCSNQDFNETMGCKNYLQGFKCENFICVKF